MSLNYYAPRRCYEFVKDSAGPEIRKSGELSSYRKCPAYVLLGQPGSGKTTAFKEEAKQDGCAYVSARDFITFDVNSDWRANTLFIDGLDEVRAGKDNALSPFDEIRKKLAQLERPRFRLSCRAADWYGASDREALTKVSPEQPKELFLAELTEEDLLQVLIDNHHKTESDASSFLQEAQHRGLIELIKNPQILEMLVVAVGEGSQWPERKADVFRLACERLLLEEWNQTHNIAHRNQTPPAAELMQASGMLCAVMLLARKPGFASMRSNANDGYPFVGDMADGSPALLQLVARTRLFATHDGHSEYSHRIFAEYLSAYYLSNKIVQEALPVGRVLALITGADGGIVSGLRGIYAWIAALCHTERDKLMQRDPLGVVLYGDVSLFSKEGRLKLLHELSNHAEKAGNIGIDYRNTQPFGALCQTDMEQEYLSILKSRDHSDTHQYLLAYVLASMTAGKALPGLSDALISLLKDPDYQLWNRRQALQVLVRFNDQQALQKILEDVWQGIISDPEDELLGQLLLSQYPNQISPDEIFNYLRSPKRTDYIGIYDYFWSYELTKLSSDGQIPPLLDAFVTIPAQPRHGSDEYTYRTMVGNLLVRGVEKYGADVETTRLLGWLGLGLDEYDSILLSHQDATRIRKWLQQHPEIQKQLVECRLHQCSKSDNFNWCVSRISARLFNADFPEDYGRWCLHKAMAGDDQNIRKYFFSESISTLFAENGNTGMSLELVEEAVARDSCLKQYWNVNRVAEISPEYGQSNRARKRFGNEKEQAKQAFLQYVRNNLREIEAGTAKPALFSKLASAYYGYFIEARGDNPRARLMHFFNNDIGLVQSMLSGLQRFIYREDIPDSKEILQAHVDGKHSIYSHPYRAGMDELAKGALRTLLELEQDKLEKALAFHLADGTEKTGWYKAILRERPELLVRIYTMYGKMALRAGKTHLAGSYSLAFDENHRQLAALVVLPLLKSFRVRSTSKQLVPLYDLLAAALQHADRNDLKQLTRKKLSLKSMDAAQRTLWLAAGIILAPEQFAQQLIGFISGKEARMSYLGGFLSYHGKQWQPVDKLPLSGVSLLVELLGPYHAPVSTSDDASEVVMQLISRLATSLEDEGTDAIESLLRSDQLSKWHPWLRRTLHTQRAAKREARFRHADLEQVHSALNNGPPANVADLACITHERIQELAERIKYENTNDFRQYWKEYPVTRRHEETCRDQFLSDLKPLLKNMQVDAQPEGRYADEGRADIRVSFSSYNVPIEIKCNDSKDLWHGLRKQLIERYTIDPGAYGYGIYLVFWFGHEKTTPPPAGDSKPETPRELEERLSRLLDSDEQRKKISVCAVDCTAPGPA